MGIDPISIGLMGLAVSAASAGAGAIGQAKAAAQQKKASAAAAAAEKKRMEIAKKQALYQQFRDTRQNVRDRLVKTAEARNRAAQSGAGDSSGALGSTFTTASASGIAQQGIFTTASLQMQDQSAANQYTNAMNRYNQAGSTAQGWSAIASAGGNIGSGLMGFGQSLNTYNNQQRINSVYGA